MTASRIELARRLQAIAQSGLAYTKDPFDVERFRAVRQAAAELLAAQSGSETEQVLRLFEAEDGYATPKLDVRGVVFRDDQILLVRERQDGLWTLPGGWVDVGDSPSEAVRKEVKEESGYDVRAVKLLMLYDRERHGHPPLAWHIYKLFFLCQIDGGGPQSGMETDEVGFFDEDALPDLSRTRVTPEEIHRLFEHHRNPDWPTEFD